MSKYLLKRFHLNGSTKGFHPQTQKVELHQEINGTMRITPKEVLSNGHTAGFHSQTQKL